MQTLIDPFELASTLPRPAVRDVAVTLIDIDLQLEDDAERQAQGPGARDVARESNPPSPDSSSRLRCWCSEDD